MQREVKNETPIFTESVKMVWPRKRIDPSNVGRPTEPNTISLQGNVQDDLDYDVRVTVCKLDDRKVALRSIIFRMLKLIGMRKL